MVIVTLKGGLGLLLLLESSCEYGLKICSSRHELNSDHLLVSYCEPVSPAVLFLMIDLFVFLRKEMYMSNTNSTSLTT